MARRSGVSLTVAYQVESGQPTSLEAAVRLTSALGLRLDVELVDRKRSWDRPTRGADSVHSAMGEFEARHFRLHGLPVGMDEPYQHYQFAGRADLIAWDAAARALLHIENRTRFPDVQESAGSFNAKVAYLGTAVAERMGVSRWASETHVIAALWSSEVLHTLRSRPESFKALCPDPPDAVDSWWAGKTHLPSSARCLVLLDPLAAGRQRPSSG